MPRIATIIMPLLALSTCCCAANVGVLEGEEPAPLEAESVNLAAVFSGESGNATGKGTGLAGTSFMTLHDGDLIVDPYIGDGEIGITRYDIRMEAFTAIEGELVFVSEGDFDDNWEPAASGQEYPVSDLVDAPGYVRIWTSGPDGEQLYKAGGEWGTDLPFDLIYRLGMEDEHGLQDCLHIEVASDRRGEALRILAGESWLTVLR